MKLGASQGSHWVWEGTPSPVQSDDAVNLHPSGALVLTDSASSTRSWSRDVSSCGSGHSPFTVVTGLVVPTKPPH